MGQFDIYYVPKDQKKWNGRKDEIEALFWPLGFDLYNDRKLVDINRGLVERSQDTPRPEHNFSFGYMGVSDAPILHLVPNELYDNWSCPQCPQRYDYQYFIDISKSEGFIDPETIVPCPACGDETLFKNLKYDEEFTFAKTYIHIADVDPEEWVPLFLNKVEWKSNIRHLIENSDLEKMDDFYPCAKNFKYIIEKILGPCEVYSSWST